MANLEGSALILLSGCWVVNGFLLKTFAMSYNFKLWTFIEKHLRVCKCVLWVVDRKPKWKKENSIIECQKPLQWKLLYCPERHVQRDSMENIFTLQRAGWSFREKNLTNQDHWKKCQWRHFCKMILLCFLHAPWHFKSKISSEWH